MAKVEIPVRKLNSGYDIPVLGFGTWAGTDDKGDFKADEVPKVTEAVGQAIDVGYRHIDTAHFYRVEGPIGQVVAQKIAEGAVRREDLFITTKLWNHMHAAADVERSLRASLERLKMDYVDLFLVHFPCAISVDGEYAVTDITETWRGMEAVQALGLARSVGVSNFNVVQLRRILEGCKVPPAVNQVEINLNLGQQELVEFCRATGIAVTAYTPFGTMMPGRCPARSPEPKIDSQELKDLAGKYGKTPAQIVLRYLFQRDLISVPKTVTRDRMVDNASIFDFQLSPLDCAGLQQYDCGYRTVRSEFWQDHPDYPFEKVSVEGKVSVPRKYLMWED